ncbi:MAG: alpha/beta fold hydrolase [Actinomycetota bacterium]
MAAISPRLALLLAGPLLLAACSIGSSDAGPPPPATRAIPSTAVAPATTTDAAADTPATAPPTTAMPLDYVIEWESAGDRVDRGRLTVPLEYADSGGATIELEVARHRAPDGSRVGAMLVNRGGPGAASSDMAYSATSWFPSEITDRFDIVAWDPRGTGQSGAAVDCIDDAEHDRHFAEIDITPDDDAARDELVALAEEFAAGCVERTEGLTHIGTTNSARDMDAIRQALGEPQVSYFGFSYGSALGAAWATLFPTTVRAAVLDGATDPLVEPLERSRQQLVAFEESLSTFLNECAEGPCEFADGADPENALDELLLALDAEPVPTVGGRAALNRGVATTGIVQAMYSDAYWPTLERALEDAAAGDGAGLLALHDTYHQRADDGSYPSLIESFQAITCMDRAERLSVEQADANAAVLTEAAPRLSPGEVGSYFCTFFPESAEPMIEITGVGAGPIVVIGTTGDPATPLGSSRAMADALEDGRFLVVDANRHTGYGVDDCVDGAVNDYLVQLTAPDDSTCQ